VAEPKADTALIGAQLETEVARRGAVSNVPEARLSEHACGITAEESG
jgi:hypothetical protein